MFAQDNRRPGCHEASGVAVLLQDLSQQLAVLVVNAHQNRVQPVQRLVVDVVELRVVQLGVFEAVGAVVGVDYDADDQVERERREVELFLFGDELELVQVVDFGDVEVGLRLEALFSHRTWRI